MLSVLRTTWPLLLGVMLLMVGNGMQGTLLGIRGAIEGIPTTQMSVVMAAYFAGFLAGSLTVPRLIQRVGHVRVFAALGSLISAIIILFPLAPEWWVWALGRLVIGYSFCGVYITAESWLNAGATNETRGTALSAYMIVQMLGLVGGQVLLNVGDPSGWVPFVIPSILVSLAFTPILLSTEPAPRFEGIRRMGLRQLWQISPLGCVGIFLLGGVFAAILGMAAVWAAAAGLTTKELTAFVAAIYAGGLVAQYPVGWLSDRLDRRKVILALGLVGLVAAGAIVQLRPDIWGLLALTLVVGGVANPLYSLVLAYTTDLLDAPRMPSASAGLQFIYGVGSAAGPLVTGWMMQAFGLDGFWIYLAALFAGLSAYTAWRLTRRATAEANAPYTPVSPTATPLAVEVVMEQANAADMPGDRASGNDEGERHSPAPPPTPEEVNRFWIDETGPALWYAPTPALDAEIRARFGPTWERAEEIAPRWAAQGATGALAALILTDQFPRNMFRGDPRSFATDALARRIADAAIAAGHDLATPEPARQFFYMPFEHSETLADQDRAIALFSERMPGENLRHAQLHRDTIAAFGRFPWRNATLGRDSTAEEQALLEAGGYGALVSGKVKLAEAG